MKKVLYVGLDVHKETISVAFAPHGEEEVRFVGTFPNNSMVLESLLRKMMSGGGIVRFAYEAGPGGYTLYRQLREKGYECMVVAPSLIPRRSGERVKTDKRDALMIARLYRAGELTGIYVPEKRALHNKHIFQYGRLREFFIGFLVKRSSTSTHIWAFFYPFCPFFPFFLVIGRTFPGEEAKTAHV